MSVPSEKMTLSDFNGQLHYGRSSTDTMIHSWVIFKLGANLCPRNKSHKGW